MSMLTTCWSVSLIEGTAQTDQLWLVLHVAGLRTISRHLVSCAMLLPHTPGGGHACHDAQLTLSITVPHPHLSASKVVSTEAQLRKCHARTSACRTYESNVVLVANLSPKRRTRTRCNTDGDTKLGLKLCGKRSSQNTSLICPTKLAFAEAGATQLLSGTTQC